MKKTNLILLAGILIGFASCKKEAAETAKPQSPTISKKEQIADLIKRADKNLYDEVYGQHPGREASVDIKKAPPGYFYIPGQTAEGGNVDNATCLLCDRLCWVVISASSATPPDPDLTSDCDLTFSAEDNAILIINTDHPVVQQITGVSTKTNSDGSINVRFKQ